MWQPWPTFVKVCLLFRGRTSSSMVIYKTDYSYLVACSSHLSLQVVQVLALSKNELHRCTFCAFATLKIEVGDFKRWWSSHKNVWKKWKRKSKGSKQCWKCIFSTEMQSMLKLWGFFWQRWKSIRHVTPWSTLFKCMHKHISLIIFEHFKTFKNFKSFIFFVQTCLFLSKLA